MLRTFGLLSSHRSWIALVAAGWLACAQPAANRVPKGEGGATSASSAAGGAGQGGSQGSGGTTAAGGSSTTPKSGGAGGSTSAGGAGGTTTKASGGTGGGTSRNGGSGGSSSGGTTSTPSGGTGAGGSGTGGSSTKPGPTLIGDVQFSKPSQSFKDRIEVAMTTSVSGAEIRYTVDGAVPSASSTLYGGSAVSLTETTQLRAQAFSGGTALGSLSTAIYIARTIDPTSDLPIIVVDGYGKGKPSDKEVYLDAAVMVWEPENGVAAMASLPTQAMRAGYHVRGQSSATFPQTPYKIETWDNANQDLDYPLLGMPSDSDWALIPPYYDRTLIRNPFTFRLGKDMGMQAPRDAFAEVYINYDGGAISDADYQGIYWFTETIKNNKVRTKLKQLEPQDTTAPEISGGYIFKFDQMAAEEPKLTCTGSDPIAGMGIIGGGGKKSGTCWTDLEVVDPDPLNAEQQAWVTDHIQHFHDCLHQTPIGDYASFIDVPSFVDNLIVNELTLNVDAYVRSAFYHKDRDQKIKAGPLWDYNFALGGVGAMEAAPKTTTDTGWRYSGTRNVNNWYPKLTADPAFMAQVKTRYQELRKTLLSDAAVKQRMADLAAPLKQAVVRDFAKWPVSAIIKSTTGFTGGPTAPTWEGQLQVMEDFLIARLAWMDANLP